MHDFILSAVEHEVDGGGHRPIERPANVSFSTDSSAVYCRWCKDIVEFLTVVQAAMAFKTDLQDIRFLLDKGDIHLVRMERRTLEICRRSLEVCFETRRTRLLDSHFELKVERSMSGATE